MSSVIHDEDDKPRRSVPETRYVSRVRYYLPGPYRFHRVHNYGESDVAVFLFSQHLLPFLALLHSSCSFMNKHFTRTDEFLLLQDTRLPRCASNYAPVLDRSAWLSSSPFVNYPLLSFSPKF